MRKNRLVSPCPVKYDVAVVICWALDKRLVTIAFSVLLLVPVGAQQAFAVDSGVEQIEVISSTEVTDLVSPNTADPMDIVYENGSPLGDGNSAFIHSNSVADDFVLDNPTSITDVHFIYVLRNDLNPPSPFDPNIQYAILGDSNGPDPGNVLDLGVATNIETEDLGTLPDNRGRILVWFDLESPVPLDAGVTYWLWLHAGDGFERPPQYGWQVATPSSIGEAPRFYTGSDFTGTPETIIGALWFQITDKSLVSPPVGGEFLPIDSTAVLVAGAQLNVAWMIPVIVSAIGIGIVIARKF